jgi:p24 family protein alpha
VISQKSGPTGRFTFTTAESGEHRLCFQTSSAGGWFSSSHVKLHLDLAVGETGDIDRSSKDKSESLAQRVQDLNARLQDIRREQVFQRVFPYSDVFKCRNEKQSFVINPNLQMQGLLDGLFCNWSSLVGLVHGNSIISRGSFRSKSWCKEISKE